MAGLSAARKVIQRPDTTKPSNLGPSSGKSGVQKIQIARQGPVKGYKFRKAAKAGEPWAKEGQTALIPSQYLP